MKEITILLAIIAAVIIAIIVSSRMIVKEVRRELQPTPPTKKEWKDQNIFL